MAKYEVPGHSVSVLNLEKTVGSDGIERKHVVVRIIPLGAALPHDQYSVAMLVNPTRAELIKIVKKHGGVKVKE